LIVISTVMAGIQWALSDEAPRSLMEDQSRSRVCDSGSGLLADST
jgi:hypothetical protein